MVTHSSPENAETDALASVVGTLASTETADIDFMLQLLESTRSREDKRADLLLFRNQIIQCAAGEMYRIRAQQMREPVAWRWRPKGTISTWIYNPEPQWLAEHRDEIDAQPLYAFTSPESQS